MSDASAEQRESAPRYDFEGIDLDSDSVHADVVKLVDEGSRVLELGPATGYMSHAFVERGCTWSASSSTPRWRSKPKRSPSG